MRWNAGIASLVFVAAAIVAGCGGGGGGGATAAAPAPVYACMNVAEPIAIGASVAPPGPQQLIVTPLPQASSASVEQALSTVSPAVPRATGRGGYVLPGAKAGAIETLMTTGLFERVERDFVARSAGIPNDPGYAFSWHLAQIGAPAAWDWTYGSTSILVGVVDSGCFPHPDLVQNLMTGRNFLDGTNNTWDTLGHGTGVSGTIAASINNNLAGSGVAPNVRFMPLLVLNANNQAFYSDIALAIRYAADSGARLVNVSLGGADASVELQNAVDYAWARNCVVVASAMNEGDGIPRYPAACNRAVAVSAMTPQGTKAPFSCFGPWVDVTAPGVDIYSTAGVNTVGSWSGTSFATGVASGVAALALSMNTQLSPSSLVTLLRQTADDVGQPGFDPAFGWGCVNAQRIVAAALAGADDDVTDPIVAITSPSCELIVNGPDVVIQGAAQDTYGIDRIEVHVNGEYVDEVQSSTFLFTVPVLPGNSQLTIVAYDNAGNAGLAWTRVTRP